MIVIKIPSILYIDAKNLDYTAENASSWGNYMRVVAQLLVNDATALYDDWAVNRHLRPNLSIAEGISAVC